MRDLKECRVDIDSIDQELLKLLKKRLEVAQDIASYKIEHNQGIVDKVRENSKLEKLIKEGQKLGISSMMVNDIFKNIMAHTVSFEQSYILEQANLKKLERDTSIAYLGKQIGTYSHLAATKFTENFVGKVRMDGCDSFSEIIEKVEDSQCEFAILPIENSSSGSINEVLDLISTTKATMTGEVFLPIDHSILGLKDLPLEEISDIYSHPQPIAQCSTFIQKKLSHAKIHYTSSTSDAMAQVAALQNPKAVAIASKDSGQFFNLVSLQTDIANHKNNYTRFVVFSMTPIVVPQNLSAKTSMIFSVKKYEPGSLIKVLNIFKENGINLLKLNSRPKESASGEIWEEIFFADVLANLDSPQMQNIISKLNDLTTYLKILGCYLSLDHSSAKI